MEHVDLLIHSAGQLCIVPGHEGPQRGAALGDLGLLADGALAAADGRVVAVGPSGELRARYRATTTLDAAGRCVLPGFVDPHTHLPWLGDRAGEFEQRLGGATYMEIMAAGGGIMSTVRRTPRRRRSRVGGRQPAAAGADVAPRHDQRRGQDGLRPGDGGRVAPTGRHHGPE
jgi:imidazolonepropionase